MTKPEIENHDISTPEGWADEIQHLQTYLHAIAQDSELAPRSIIYCRCDPDTGEAHSFPRPYFIIPTSIDGDNRDGSKDYFAHSSMLVALAGDAIATATLIEAWTSIEIVGQPGPHRRPQR